MADSNGSSQEVVGVEEETVSPTYDRKNRKVLLAGPYIGEFGWEVFSWQPLVRSVLLTSQMKGEVDHCIVYTGPGRDRLYPWAEVRTFPAPDYESECLAWHEMNEEKNSELKSLIDTMIGEVKEEGWGDIKTLTQAQLPSLGHEFFERGMPDLLLPEGPTDWNKFDLKDPIDPGRKTVALCVRDRAMSDWRNLEYEDWYDLAELLDKEFNVIMLGIINRPDDWQMPEGVIDLTNKTTVNDLIDIFPICDLVAGGSTGTLHLASRCARPHLVWAGEKEVRRYAEANWFGAPHKVYVEGWQPDIYTVHIAIQHYLKQGEWI